MFSLFVNAEDQAVYKGVCIEVYWIIDKRLLKYISILYLLVSNDAFSILHTTLYYDVELNLYNSTSSDV